MKCSYKIIIVAILMFLANPVNALSNSEVRSQIQRFIDTQQFPQDMGDELTIWVGSRTTTRGLLYNYKLKIAQDKLPSISRVFKSIEADSFKNLCTNPAMRWYKKNDVDIIYRYIDKKKNVVSIFKINGSDC